jgi:hypothetical protein
MHQTFEAKTSLLKISHPAMFGFFDVVSTEMLEPSRWRWHQSTG